MPTPLENWFSYLIAIHDRALDLSHLAGTSLRVFEGQKPSDVIPLSSQQDNLSDLLLQRFNQTVPSALYQLDTFRAFVNFLATEREAILQAEFRRVAVQHKPALFDLTMKKFLALAVTEAFPTQAARTELFDFVDACSPTDFFSSQLPNQQRFEALLTGASVVSAAVKDTYKQAVKAA